MVTGVLQAQPQQCMHTCVLALLTTTWFETHKVHSTSALNLQGQHVIVSAALETRVATCVLQQLKLLKGLGNLLRVKIVYEHCSSYDKIIVREQCPFAEYSTYLTSK